LKAKAAATAKGIDAPKSVGEATKLLGALDEAMGRGLEFAGKQARVVKRRFAAVDRLADACDSVDYAVEAVAQARSSSNFDPEDLDEVLVELKMRLEKLSSIVARDQSVEGSGLAWLRAMLSRKLPEEK
jgi:hypothetical protein